MGLVGYGLWLLLCLTASTAHRPAAAATLWNVKYGATLPGTLPGDVLVLGVGSLTYSGPHPDNVSIVSAQACSSQCANLPGCTAWNYCNRVGGCGSGCKAFTTANPKVKPLPPQNPDVSNLDLPLRVFGPWTYPFNSNGCSYNRTSRSNTDAWPFGMCTLLVLPASGNVQRTKQGEGWLSGVVTKPAECKGIAAAACDRCVASAAPYRCLNCTRDPRAQHAKPIKFILENGNLQQAGCGACANISSSSGQVDRCFNCVLDKKACQTCVYAQTTWGTGPPDAASCLRCVAKKGDGYIGGCNACAQSTQPGRCFTCLDDFPLRYCYGANPPTSNCLLATDQTPCDLCANAALSTEAYWQCLACYKTANLADDCKSCSNIPSNAKDQVRCYKCVQNARPSPAAYVGCGLCFSRWLQPGRTPECLACVEDAGVAVPAKSFCNACWDQQHLAPGSSATCRACLGSHDGGGKPLACMPSGVGRRS